MDADEDALREVTLECKPFSVCGLTRWNTQLQLINSCYRGQSDSVSDSLRTGTPCEVSPLFTRRRVGMQHHPGVARCPLHALREARAQGVKETELKAKVLECRSAVRDWEATCVKSVHHGVGLFDSEQLRCLKLLPCEDSYMAPGLTARDRRWGGAADRRRDLARPGIPGECGPYVSVSY